MYPILYSWRTVGRTSVYTFGGECALSSVEVEAFSITEVSTSDFSAQRIIIKQHFWLVQNNLKYSGKLRNVCLNIENLKESFFF